MIMKLTIEQKKKGRETFLAGNPEIKSRIEALTESEAEAMCATLDQYKEQVTMKALSELAQKRGVNAHELFLSCIADTAEEFEQMLTVK